MKTNPYQERMTMQLTPNELKHPSHGAPALPLEGQPHETPAAVRQRKARILLREVDIVLKEQGVEAAIKTLRRVRRKILLTPTISDWLRDYQKMLKAWHLGLLPDVVAEYRRYGFRRARTVAYSQAFEIGNERKAALYWTCEQVLEQMSERFRRSISDVEQERPETQLLQEPPSMVSIEHVHEDELEHGTKY
jgi:hypothetical protein